MLNTPQKKTIRKFNSLLLKIAMSIVELPMKHGDFP